MSRRAGKLPDFSKPVDPGLCIETEDVPCCYNEGCDRCHGSGVYTRVKRPERVFTHDGRGYDVGPSR